MSSEIKWFKLMNDMFDDEKIEYIESLPDGDAIITIWVKILCLASKSNEGGNLMITSEIPYTPDLLAHKFKKTPVQIDYALTIMQKLKMIDIIDNIICVSNWVKYQSVDELSRIREQTRLRVAKYRENKKLLECNATSNATVTQKCNENALISISNSISNIFNYWNNKDIIVHKELTDKISNVISKALKIYSEEEIKTYIDRYNTVIKDKTYFFDYKWTLVDFLNRKDGISSFTDEGSKWVSYCNQKNISPKSTRNQIDNREYTNEQFNQVFDDLDSVEI